MFMNDHNELNLDWVSLNVGILALHCSNFGLRIVSRGDNSCRLSQTTREIAGKDMDWVRLVQAELSMRFPEASDERLISKETKHF
jgi:hypothetical protein